MSKRFHIGDRVQISRTHYYAKGALGTVQQPPSYIRQFVEGPEGWQGEYRVVQALHGPLTFYWIEFDTPQVDEEGDGPYEAGEIDSRYLHPVVN